MLIDFLDYLVIHGDGMGKGQVMILIQEEQLGLKNMTSIEKLI